MEFELNMGCAAIKTIIKFVFQVFHGTHFSNYTGVKIPKIIFVEQRSLGTLSFPALSVKYTFGNLVP